MGSKKVRTRLSYVDKQSILTEIATPIWVFDWENGRIDWANEAGLSLWEADDLGELRSRNLFSDQSARARMRIEQYRTDFLANRSITEQFTIYPKGVPKSITCRFSGIFLSDDRLAMLNQVVGAWQQTDDSPDNLRSINALFHTSTQVALYDRDGVLLYDNPAARGARPEGEHSLAARIVHQKDYARLQELLKANREAQAVMEVHTRLGIRWYEFDLRYTLDPVSGREAMLMSASDVTERKKAQDMADFLAFHDPLTKLPNRAHLLRDTAVWFAKLLAEGRAATLVFVDLDRFKSVNDTLGHSVGDELLVAFANRLRTICDPADHLARLSGDEFVVLTDRPQGQAELDDWSCQLDQALNQPYQLGQHTVKCSVSMGFCRMPDNGTDINLLLQRADVAMYEAKHTRRGSFRIFSQEMSQRFSRKVMLEKQLQTVLERDELELCFQPRISLETGRLAGAEALLRWRHPEEGLISPADFIPIMEETGLIIDVGDWVLRTACDWLKTWQALDPDLMVSVNISGQQCLRPGLANHLLSIVEQSGCHPSGLEFEITESVLIGDDPIIHHGFRLFKDAGIGLAIDDFGTGYSNLAYVQNYPVSCIKIDRSFVGDSSKTAITKMIISMCRLLNVTIVAEGVETLAQHDWLKAQGCDQYQGFLFAPAVSSNEFEDLIMASQATSHPLPIASERKPKRTQAVRAIS